MFKRILILFTLSLLIFSCKKKDSTGTFTVTGVHDLNMNDSNGNYLLVAVDREKGSQEIVSLSVTGLPQGVTAYITAPAGTTSFTSKIIFSDSFKNNPGIYPIKIVAASTNTTNEYPLNLTLAPMNGWYLNGVYFRNDSMKLYTFVGSNQFINCDSRKTPNSRLYIEFSDLSTVPLADGIYRITQLPLDSDEVSIECYTGGVGYFSGNWGTMELKTINGKLSAKASFNFLGPTATGNGNCYFNITGDQ